MPTTFKIASHEARPVYRLGPATSTSKEFFSGVLQSPSVAKEILQTSLEGTDEYGLSAIRIKENGFVNTIVDAYQSHHHLIIR
jgi:hypothetical protein